MKERVGGVAKGCIYFVARFQRTGARKLENVVDVREFRMLDQRKKC